MEIKARVADLAAVRGTVEQLAGKRPVVLEQEDTFFHCPKGRLKLRCFGAGAPAELIFYQRGDTTGPKESHYIIHRTSDPQGLLAVLSSALNITGLVRKQRELYLVGSTRVHLDDVEGLGSFVELEVVLGPGQDASEGIAVANDLMAALGIRQEQLIKDAYIDLIEKGQDTASLRGGREH